MALLFVGIFDVSGVLYGVARLADRIKDDEVRRSAYSLPIHISTAC